MELTAATGASSRRRAPTRRRRALCATLAHTGDALVLMGGWDGADGFFDDVWTFREGAWTREAATLPGPRSRHAACTLPDGRVVAVTHREVFVYDPSDGSVTTQPTTGPPPSASRASTRWLASVLIRWS